MTQSARRSIPMMVVRSLGLLLSLVACAINIRNLISYDAGLNLDFAIAASMIANTTSIAMRKPSILVSASFDIAAWVMLLLGSASQIAVEKRLSYRSSSSYVDVEDSWSMEPMVIAAVTIYLALGLFHFGLSIFGLVKLGRSANQEGDFSKKYINATEA